MPFGILEFKKIMVSLVARNEFKNNSLIQLNEYIIDKNERIIKKNNLILKLSEKEINFLILFSKNKKPISNGIITCLNKKQAKARSSNNKKNKGLEASKAILSVLNNF